MNRTADTANLAGLVQIALGTAVPVTGIQQLRGGSKKGVYRVRLGGPPTSVMVYSWAQEENFWPRATDAPDPGDPFADATGLHRLLAATHALEKAGVRSPRVLWSDDSHQHYPADVAVIEDVPGGSLEALMESDPARADEVLHDLAGSLTRPHRPAMRLSLVAGPLRLLDGDFPDREFMQHIAEHNLRVALALIEEPV